MDVYSNDSSTWISLFTYPILIMFEIIYQVKKQVREFLNA